MTVLAENEEFDFPPLPLPIRPNDTPVWIVRNSYPRLETLHVDGSNDELHLIAEFLAGLPDTILDLNPTYMASYGANAVSLLPPHIRELHLNSSLDSVDRFTNLTSLILSDPESVYRSRATNLGHWSHTTMAPLTAPGSHLPASLTFLNAACTFEVLASLLHSSPLTKLTTLLIRGISKNLHSAEEFFDVVPSTVTRLDVSCWLRFGSGISTDDGALSARVAESASIRPSIKSLSIQVYEAKNERIYSDIISLAPNVQVLSFIARNSKPMGLDQIRILCDSPLRELSAPIASECFMIGSDGTYPLASLLPNLTALDLLGLDVSEEIRESDIDFGGIPPSVTKFNSSMKNLTTRTIHLLPPSVTSFRMSSLIVSIDAENFDQLFRSPAPSVSESGIVSASDAKERIFFGISKQVQLSRRGDRIVIDSFTLLNDGLVILSLKWPKSIPFELLLGCSEITLDASTKIEPPLSSTLSKNLSSLTKLSVTSNQSEPMLLAWETMPALTDLEMQQFADFFGSAVPPNLTRLSCLGPNLPHSLPRTLKVLACTNMTPLALARLDLLEEWTQLDSGSTETFLDWRGAIPTSVTKLHIPWRHLYHDADRCWSREEISIHLFDRLPGLKHIDFGRELPHTLAESLCDTAPSYVEIKAMLLVLDDASNFSLIANRAGLCHGGLDLMPYESLRSATTKVRQRAYKRLNFTIFSELPSDWPSLCPYFSKNITLLTMSDFCTVLGGDGVVLLPPSVTTLICESISNSLPKPAVLPVQLRKLVIQRRSPTSMTPERTFVLPSGMTHLDANLKIVNPSFAWPSGLVFLRVRMIPKMLPKSLASLPASITHLNLEEAPLSSTHFSSLPQGLKMFEGSVEQPHQQAFVEYALKSGLTWIMSSKEMALLNHFNFESSLDMLAAKPNTN